MGKRVIVILVLWCGLLAPQMGVVSAPAYAISPEEQLADPVLEKRARALSAQLRCLVCQNQSIEDSDADLARDLRSDVRTRLQDGQDDGTILQALTATYGDYILLKPPVNPATYLLWATPVILILLAGGLFFAAFRKSPQKEEAPEVAPAFEEVNDKPQSPQKMGRLFGGLMGVIFIASAIVYSQLGTPDLKALPVAERGEERAIADAAQSAQTQEKQERLAKAEATAQTQPASVEAQMALALAAAEAKEYVVEIAALKRALALTEGNPAILSMLAEAMSRQADGQIILPARALIDEVLAAVPTEPRALFMKGLAAYQDERYEDAIAYWGRLQETAPRNGPWPSLAAQNRKAAADAAGIALDDAPNTDQAAPMLAEDDVQAMAEASEEDQKEMILSMVAGLEERLQERPDDAEGWQRLIRARQVLEDEAGLMRALIGAAKSAPDARDPQLALLEFLLVQRRDDGVITAAEAAVLRLEAINDTALEYLFFAGHVARLKGDKKAALGFWEALYDKLPDDANFKPQIAAQIEALK